MQTQDVELKRDRSATDPSSSTHHRKNSPDENNAMRNATITPSQALADSCTTPLSLLDPPSHLPGDCSLVSYHQGIDRGPPPRDTTVRYPLEYDGDGEYGDDGVMTQCSVGGWHLESLPGAPRGTWRLPLESSEEDEDRGDYDFDDDEPDEGEGETGEDESWEVVRVTATVVGDKGKVEKEKKEWAKQKEYEGAEEKQKKEKGKKEWKKTVKIKEEDAVLMFMNEREHHDEDDNDGRAVTNSKSNLPAAKPASTSFDGRSSKRNGAASLQPIVIPDDDEDSE